MLCLVLLYAGSGLPIPIIYFLHLINNIFYQVCYILRYVRTTSQHIGKYYQNRINKPKRIYYNHKILNYTTIKNQND